MAKRFSKFAGTFEEVQKNDLFFLNNPVLIQGLGLSPVIMAAITLKNACILAVAATIMGMFTRYFCGFFHQRLAYRLRTAAYALIAALTYIPTLYIVTYIFGADVRYVGIYLPMLVFDQLILIRSESLVYEYPRQTVKNGFMLSLGFSTVIIIIGALREFLAKGELWGETVIGAKPLPIMGNAIGGFIVVALFAALLQALINDYKKNMARRTKTVA